MTVVSVRADSPAAARWDRGRALNPPTEPPFSERPPQLGRLMKAVVALPPGRGPGCSIFRPLLRRQWWWRRMIATMTSPWTGRRECSRSGSSEHGTAQDFPFSVCTARAERDPELLEAEALSPAAVLLVELTPVAQSSSHHWQQPHQRGTVPAPCRHTATHAAGQCAAIIAHGTRVPGYPGISQSHLFRTAG